MSLNENEANELAQLEAAFERNGGRGVEDAERIDALRRKRDGSLMRFNLYVNSERVAEFTVEDDADAEPTTVSLEADSDGHSIVGIDVVDPAHVAVGHWPDGEQWEVLTVIDARPRLDIGPDSTGVKLTRAQIAAWAGYELDGDQLDRLEEAIPNSSIPEAIATIAEQLRDETVGPDGEFLPHGRCDTCGAPCDERGCTIDREHKVAIDAQTRAGVRYIDNQPRYDMYTAAGNLLVHQLVTQLRADMLAGNVTRENLPGRAAGVLVDADKAGHHEIYDTEPPWAVTDALNDTCQQLGWQPITKEDFA